jgi:hypothetical protein
MRASAVSSYRDTFRLLLGFAENRLHKIPTALALSDLDAPFILEFLDHLEQGRGNTPRTRNARLTTIRSFMKYASHLDPTALPVIQRVLAIPPKRFDRPLVGFLPRPTKRAWTSCTVRLRCCTVASL